MQLTEEEQKAAMEEKAKQVRGIIQDELQKLLDFIWDGQDEYTMDMDRADWLRAKLSLEVALVVVKHLPTSDVRAAVKKVMAELGESLFA